MGSGIDPPCNGSCLTVDAQDHGGVFGQQTENQNTRMASTTKSDETIGGHAHFLVLSLLAILRKITKSNEQQTTVPLSLLTTHLCARACLSGKSAGGGGKALGQAGGPGQGLGDAGMLVRGLGIRTGPGRCREARARPVHLNRAWAMQEGSCEAWASQQGLARSEWNLGAAWAMQEGSREAWASQQGLGDTGRSVRGQGIGTRPCEN